MTPGLYLTQYLGCHMPLLGQNDSQISIYLKIFCDIEEIVKYAKILHHCLPPDYFGNNSLPDSGLYWIGFDISGLFVTFTQQSWMDMMVPFLLNLCSSPVLQTWFLYDVAIINVIIGQQCGFPYLTLLTYIWRHTTFVFRITIMIVYPLMKALCELVT